MIVVVIIGILAALAIPRFMTASTKSKQSEAKQILKQIYVMERAYFQETGIYSADLVELGVEVGVMGSQRYGYTIVVTGPAFVATALAPDPGIDDDASTDEWTIDESGNLINTVNDVTQG